MKVCMPGASDPIDGKRMPKIFLFLKNGMKKYRHFEE
jgi:hypothetical protein